MEFIRVIFQKQMTKRILTLLVVGVLLYLLKDMLNLLLLTFLFTYLMYSVLKFIQNTISKIFHYRIEKVLLTLVLYVLMIASIVYAAIKYVPIAVYQVINIFNEIAIIIDNQKDIVYGKPVLDYLISLLNSVDIPAYIQGKSSYLFKLAGNIGELGLNLVISILLSLFFILEKDRITRFVQGFKESKISGFFNELQYFGSRLLNSFGKVIQAQILIALCNSALSVIGLWFLGFHQLLGLGLMIFLLSLIPVAGVVISFVPLAIIAFRMGGFIQVLYVVVMILGLHAVEAYLLNPKLMSVKTELPVFFTFLILILSEHFMGIWGLIIGIPIFIFILDLLEFKYTEKKKIKFKDRKEIQDKENEV